MLLKDPLQFIQLLLWIIPVFVVLSVFSWRSGKPWNFILSGYVLAALRVSMKFFPWYETSAEFTAMRFMIGLIAMSLIAFGFLDFHIKTLTMEAHTHEVAPFLVTPLAVLGSVTYLWLSPPVTASFINCMRNIEDVSWIMSSLLIIVTVWRLREFLSGMPIYTGFRMLGVVFIMIIVWKIIGFHLRVFEIKSLAPQSYDTWHTIQEALEALVGLGFGGAFLYIFYMLRLRRT